MFPLLSEICCSVAESCLTLTPWTEAHHTPLSCTISQSLLRLMSVEAVMPSNHLILCHPFLLWPQSLPASGYFPMRQHFASHHQSIRASASVLPMNIQDLFPLGLTGLISLHLGLTGLISLQSKGLSRVFSNTTVQKHQFFSAQLFL